MGGAEHLLAILDLLKKSLEHDWTYVHLISGEDYPSKNIVYIDSFFDKQENIYSGYSLITGKEHHAYRRYAYYWPYTYFSMNYKNSLVRCLNLAIVGLQVACPFMNKKHIGEFKKIYWGFIWGSYPRKAMEYVLDYLSAHPEFMKDLKWCKIPEELCFQTILMNSKFKEKMIDDNLRFWNMKRGDGSGPAYLQMDDMKELISSNAIFCRKLDAESDFAYMLYKNNFDK